MCDVEDLCLDAIDDSWTGVAFEAVLAVFVFVGIAVTADAHLAPSLETLCHRWQIPEDVAGASFLALGSSAPEIIVSAVSTAKSVFAQSAHGGTADAKARAMFATNLGVSSIIGSGMMAFTLIPGLCALVVPRTLQLKRRPVMRDVLGYVFSLLLLHATVTRGTVNFHDALGMLAAYAIYMTVTASSPWVRESYRVRVSGMAPRRTDSRDTGSRTSSASTAPDHSSPMELGKKASLTESLRVSNTGTGADEDDTEEEEQAGPVQRALSVPFSPLFWVLRVTCPECEVGSAGERLYPFTLSVAFVWLALFSTVLSAVVTRWGALLDVPATMMGMYIIAVGAQIPDTVQVSACIIYLSIHLSIYVSI